ncbi:MAG: class I SAM-dependent methyltransferase [Prolixibacteraceae bacterium]|nr:class I SAM-dependent methyltransferase [Prolixibacteraceae bacterium]
MKEFWENLFQEREMIWGDQPADSAIITADSFYKNHFSEVLIPGIGYGRNIGPFAEKGILVTGIEISCNALEILKKQYPEAETYCSSVLDFPNADQKYDGIYCYALLHLFNFFERKKLLKTYYEQLNKGGEMVFAVIAIESPLFKTGRKIGKNRKRLYNELNVFFYDNQSIEQEFSGIGLSEYHDMDEPVKFLPDKPVMKFKYIICKKRRHE